MTDVICGAVSSDTRSGDSRDWIDLKKLEKLIDIDIDTSLIVTFHFFIVLVDYLT